MRFRTAILWNGLAQFGQSGITLLSTIILARMLTPADFGLVGIVAIFIAFSQMMVDSEMGGSLLRKKVVTTTDYSTLFWYNLGVSVFIYGVLFFTAPLVADFYSKPALTGVIRLLSLCIVIHAFRVVQFIILLRELKFKQSAIINVVGGLASLGLAIYLAREGYGYWALVWQQITVAGLLVIMMTCYNRFFPRFEFSKSSFLYQFKFGIGLLGAGTVVTIANNIATNIIAKVSTLQFTGYYTQTSRITTFFQTAFGSIFNQSIYPLMAKFETTEDVKRMYRKILLFLLVSLGCFTALLVVFAPQIVRIGLGKEWMGATWIFRILALTVVPACVQVLCRNVMKTFGKTKSVMYVDSIISGLSLAFIFIGAIMALDMILWGIVAAQVVGALIWVRTAESSIREGGRISKE